MKPTIEELRSIQANEMTVLSEAQVKAIRAALDVAEAAALDEMPHRAVREAEEKFRATIAPSKPEGT
jgi:hypothetical protein